MADPLSIAAAAIAVVSASVQVWGKLLTKPANGNGYGKAIVELEMRVTEARRNEIDELEKLFRSRMHELGGKIHDDGLRRDLKLGELDMEIKLLKQILTRDKKSSG